jgi:hypothetical protein
MTPVTAPVVRPVAAANSPAVTGPRSATGTVTFTILAPGLVAATDDARLAAVAAAGHYPQLLHHPNQHVEIKALSVRARMPRILIVGSAEWSARSAVGIAGERRKPRSLTGAPSGENSV